MVSWEPLGTDVESSYDRTYLSNQDQTHRAVPRFSGFAAGITQVAMQPICTPDHQCLEEKLPEVISWRRAESFAGNKQRQIC